MCVSCAFFKSKPKAILAGESHRRLCAEEACLGLGRFHDLWTFGKFWLWGNSSRCEIRPILASWRPRNKDLKSRAVSGTFGPSLLRPHSSRGGLQSGRP